MTTFMLTVVLLIVLLWKANRPIRIEPQYTAGLTTKEDADWLREYLNLTHSAIVAIDEGVASVIKGQFQTDNLSRIVAKLRIHEEGDDDESSRTT